MMAPTTVTVTESPVVVVVNSTGHPPAGIVVDCWPDDALMILFQLAYIFLLIAYLAPSGVYCILFMHSTLIIPHTMMAIWAWKICFTIPSLFGWSIMFLCVSIVRALIHLYTTRHIKFQKELEETYAHLFADMGVSREAFRKLCSQGKIITLHSGEAYAVEKVTITDRLSLLISGKVNVSSREHFLHSIKPGEFLDSPEWESGISSVPLPPPPPPPPPVVVRPSTTTAGHLKRNIRNLGRHHVRDSARPILANAETLPMAPINENRFNVTLIAATQCRVLYWNRVPLEYHLSKDKHTSKVLSLLLGRDITNKLYAMNQKIMAEKDSILDIRLPVIITSLTRPINRPMKPAMIPVAADDRPPDQMEPDQDNLMINEWNNHHDHHHHHHHPPCPSSEASKSSSSESGAQPASSSVVVRFGQPSTSRG